MHNPVSNCEQAPPEILRASARLDCAPGVGFSQGSSLNWSQAEIAELYWDSPDIPTHVIAKELGLKQHELVAVAGPRSSGIMCRVCGEYLLATSRTDLSTIKNNERRRERCKAPKGAVCRNCLKREQAKCLAEHDERVIKSKQTIDQLQTLPYSDYLKTEHWQAKRKAALKRATYRCQTCNASSTTLDVHHNCYDRIGCEWLSDLVVLCRTCHETFHLAHIT